MTLGEDEFFEIYQPLSQPAEPENLLWEWEDTLTYPVERVWTLIEGDETENIYAKPGYHIVNVYGYLVTAVPWTDPDMEAFFFDAAEMEEVPAD